MPTTKPRITITLTEEQHQLLQALAGFQGASMSSIVVELLETAVPVLGRVVAVMEAASKAPQEMLNGLKESMERAEGTVVAQMQGHMDQMDAFAKMANEAAVRLAPPATRPARAPSTRRAQQIQPPLTNRGVRITQNSPISPMKKSISASKKVGAKK